MTAQVDQVSAASNALGLMADDLKRQVSSFKLDSTDSAAAPVVTLAPSEAESVEEEDEAA